MKTMLATFVLLTLSGCASRKITVLPPVYVPYPVASDASADEREKAQIEVIKRVGLVNTEYRRKLEEQAKAAHK